MKKLMIAAAVALAAVASQAMTFQWSTASALNKSGTTTADAGITGYLIDKNDFSMQAIYDIVAGGTYDLSDYSVKSLTTDEYGKVAVTTWGDAETTIYHAKATGATPAAYAAGNKPAMYAVFIDEAAGEVFFSTTSTKTLSGSGVNQFQPNFTLSSKAASTLTTVAATGGWYTVPEPTSGLLLLLGVAGLALKRRRA